MVTILLTKDLVSDSSVSGLRKSSDMLTNTILTDSICYDVMLF